MGISNLERAKILSQALPYIQKYNNKTVVIKYGGNAMLSEELKHAVMQDVVLLPLVGINVVLVHGGGPEINTVLEKLGKKSRFVNGLRYTDEETMEVVQMVLCGKVNKDLVSLIEDNGGGAVGLCGLDGTMLTAQKAAGEDCGLVGDITAVDTSSILSAIDGGAIPVIATVAKGEDGKVYNINADTAAAKIAAAMKAEKLILLTDVPGLLKDPGDSSSLISKLKAGEAQRLIEDGVVKGGMIPKIKCCADAVESGVSRAHIIDGRVPHSILIEMFTDEGVGTMFY